MIVILAMLAAATGLFYQQPGDSIEYTNHRGETVTINGQGLNYYNTVSMAAQQQGNDAVMLVVVLPLLVISTWFAFDDSLSARLLLIHVE